MISQWAGSSVPRLPVTLHAVTAHATPSPAHHSSVVSALLLRQVRQQCDGVRMPTLGCSCSLQVIICSAQLSFNVEQHEDFVPGNKMGSFLTYNGCLPPATVQSLMTVPMLCS